jgi:putative ABC transport system permease protein
MMKIQVMTELIRMALKNLTRHRVKTIITITAVAISVALYIFIDGWLAGMNIESQRNIVVYETGAAKVQTKEYYAKKDELPMYESFSHWEPIAEVLEQNGYAVAPRFVFSGTLFSSSGSAPIVFHAIDPEGETRVLRYPNYIDLGRFPHKGSFEIVLGYMAAEKLRIGIPRI